MDTLSSENIETQVNAIRLAWFIDLMKGEFEASCPRRQDLIIRAANFAIYCEADDEELRRLSKEAFLKCSGCIDCQVSEG